jgi:repressor LexA
MKPSTQEKILTFIRDYQADHQMPPTLREIQDHCGFAAIGTIQYHVKQLQESGFIEVKPRLSRGVTLTARATGIPIIGRVPAGPAQMAFEQIEGYISTVHGEEQEAPKSGSASKFTTVDAALAGAAMPNDARGLFALRVKGDSMIGAGILDGDLVVVRPQASAKHGDVVVARLNEDDVTVKRLIRKPGIIELAPENPKYKAIPVDENVTMVGKVIRVIRRYN